MAKGLKKHTERLKALNLLGKDLTRRSRSTCELCEVSGVSLNILEIAPVPEEPDRDSCLMACDTCKTFLENPKHEKSEYWRCLTKTLWSPLPVAQVVAVRQLRRLSAQHPWAAELLEHAYLSEDVEQWVEKN